MEEEEEDGRERDSSTADKHNEKHVWRNWRTIHHAICAFVTPSYLCTRPWRTGHAVRAGEGGEEVNRMRIAVTGGLSSVFRTSVPLPHVVMVLLHLPRHPFHACCFLKLFYRIFLPLKGLGVRCGDDDSRVLMNLPASPSSSHLPLLPPCDPPLRMRRILGCARTTYLLG